MKDISVSELKNLNQLIKDKFNYDFSNYAYSSYKRRILRLMELKKVMTLHDFTRKIHAGEISKEDFLCEVTVNVTEMYRDPSFWNCFRQLIKSYAAQHDTIKIWHAGCSSGEEVYSMLILLKDLQLLNKAELTATDIDMKILGRAKTGKISLKNMELNASNYQKSGGSGALTDHFKKENDTYVLDPALIQKVTFKELDLVHIAAFSSFDFILCRNVLIYFNQQLQNHVLKAIHKSLLTGGYFMVGSKESLSGFDAPEKFTPYNLDEKIYRKTRD